MLHSRRVLTSLLFSHLLNELELTLAIKFSSLGMSTFLKCLSTMCCVTFVRATIDPTGRQNRISAVVTCFGLDHWFSNLRIDQNHLEGSWRRQMLDSSPRVAYSVGLRWNLRICILHKFPGNSDAASPGPHFENDYKSHVAEFRLKPRSVWYWNASWHHTEKIPVILLRFLQYRDGKGKKAGVHEREMDLEANPRGWVPLLALYQRIP